MKRIIKIVAVVTLVAILTAACSQTVCPAYSKDCSKKQHSDQVKS